MKSKKLYLSFLWHMHQPYYRDDVERKTYMPWVFLHAIKDYYDMPWHISKFSDITATFNLVPSLIYQLQLYIEDNANDLLLENLAKKCKDLDDTGKDFIESYIFLSNEKNMIKPLKRYYQLYLKYKNDESIKNFSDNELLDAEVLFLLSWCGNYLRENNEFIKELLAQEQDYSQYQKTHLLDELKEFLEEIIPFYKKLMEDKKIDIITTPYYHPILPLLTNIHLGKEANKDTVLPKIDTNFREYSDKNIKYAIKYFEKIFGSKPKGFWPAEGSVSTKTLRYFEKNKIKFCFSDEDILYKSLNNYDEHNLYQNYSHKGVDIRFRDRYLSDLIGFHYSNKDPKEAAEDFMHNLKRIYLQYDFNPLVNVILDGENAWEFYANNGKDFFDELYKLIEEEDWLETVKATEVEKLDVNYEKLQELKAGSWINGNFNIWIGHSEKNRAWELIAKAQDDYERYGQNLDITIKERIEKELMIALGSDWFWWYGDDHYTIQKEQFDELFRKHLVNVYTLMQIEVYEDLYTPIIKKRKKKIFYNEPFLYIYPTIDGKKSNYFEWLNSGDINLKKELTVMDSKDDIINMLNYGYNENDLYLLFKGDLSQIEGKKLILILNNNEFIIPIKKGISNIQSHYLNLVFAYEEEIEIRIRSIRKLFKSVDFSFKIVDEEIIIQNFPKQNIFLINFKDLNTIHWYI